MNPVLAYTLASLLVVGGLAFLVAVATSDLGAEIFVGLCCVALVVALIIAVGKQWAR